MRTIVAIVLGVALATAALAKDKKDEASNQARIQVCVAEPQNTSRRPVSLPLVRDRLLRALRDSKPPKKASDQRRLAAIPLPEGGAGEGDARCDYILQVRVVELRQKTDPLWQDERNQGIGNLPSPGSRHEEVTFAEVAFKLRRVNSSASFVESSVSSEETNDENGTVSLLMDRVAQRVNSAVRETPEPMRE